MRSRGLRIGSLFAGFFFLGGCYGFLVLDRHAFWKESRDKLIGTKFNQDVNRTETGDLYTPGFNPKSKLPRSGAYKVEDEGPNKRYFIRWTNYCSYSLLVDSNGTIVSWRFESPPDACKTSS